MNSQLPLPQFYLQNHLAQHYSSTTSSTIWKCFFLQVGHFCESHQSRLVAPFCPFLCNSSLVAIAITLTFFTPQYPSPSFLDHWRVTPGPYPLTQHQLHSSFDSKILLHHMESSSLLSLIFKPQEAPLDSLTSSVYLLHQQLTWPEERSRFPPHTLSSPGVFHLAKPQHAISPRVRPNF